MSQQHVEIVRRLYRALNARDSVRAAELTHPDIEWIPDSRVGEGPVRGRDNVARFFVDRTAMFERLQTEVERCWDKDDQVLAFVRIGGRGRRR
jgi:ketosteroid isomerase-like protein